MKPSLEGAHRSFVIRAILVYLEVSLMGLGEKRREDVTGVRMFPADVIPQDSQPTN